MGDGLADNNDPFGWISKMFQRWSWYYIGEFRKGRKS